MCGRFTLRYPPAQIALALQIFTDASFAPRYNIAPSQQVFCLVDTGAGKRACVEKRWGLVPRWAKDPVVGNSMINARAETLAQKPAYRGALQQRRCLIPADGFFEWQKQGRVKQPYFIRLRNDESFALAGLYEQWNRDGQTIDSCTIITTEPNALMAPIHQRMPVILPSSAYEAWLDPQLNTVDSLQSLLCPYQADEMLAYPVGKAVGSPAHDAADCIEPIASDRPVQRDLF